MTSLLADDHLGQLGLDARVSGLEILDRLQIGIVDLCLGLAGLWIQENYIYVTVEELCGRNYRSLSSAAPD